MPTFQDYYQALSKSSPVSRRAALKELDIQKEQEQLDAKLRETKLALTIEENRIAEQKAINDRRWYAERQSYWNRKQEAAAKHLNAGSRWVR